MLVLWATAATATTASLAAAAANSAIATTAAPLSSSSPSPSTTPDRTVEGAGDVVVYVLFIFSVSHVLTEYLGRDYLPMPSCCCFGCVCGCCWVC